MFFTRNKKGQSTTMAPATKLIAVILLGVLLFLIIYFAVSGKLDEILVSEYI